MMLSDTVERIKRAVLPRLRLQQSYKNLFACNPPNPDAQRVLNHLIRTCHVNTSTLVPGDSLATACNEGKRMVVLAMLNQIALDPEPLRKQIQNAHENSEDGGR